MNVSFYVLEIHFSGTKLHNTFIAIELKGTYYFYKLVTCHSGLIRFD